MQSMLDFFDQIIKELSVKIEQLFQERQLFVMFESALGCNIATDHVMPKNVYPLYEKQILSNLDAFAAKTRCKVIETFRNELETYASIINNKNNEMFDVMKAIEEREYMLKGIQDLQPQFRDRIEQEFTVMKKEIHRLMILLGQKANLNEIELTNMVGDEVTGTLKARKQIREFRTKIATLVSERDELQAQIAKHEETEVKLQEQIKELQKQIKQNNQRCQGLEKELMARKPPVETTEAQTDIAYQFIDELYKFYVQHGQDAESLQNQIKTIQEQYKMQQNDMDNVALSKKQAEKTLEAQKRKALQDGENMSADLRQLGSEKSQIQQQYLELKQYVDREIPSLTQEIQDLKSLNTSLDKKNNELYAQIDDLTAQMKLLTAENKSLEAKAASIGKMKMFRKRKGPDGIKIVGEHDTDDNTSYNEDSESFEANEVQNTDVFNGQSKSKSLKNNGNGPMQKGSIPGAKNTNQNQMRNSIHLQDQNESEQEYTEEEDEHNADLNQSPTQKKKMKEKQSKKNEQNAAQSKNNTDIYGKSSGMNRDNQSPGQGFSQEEFDQQVALEVQHRLQMAAIDDQFRKQIDKLAIVEVGVQYDSENPDRCVFESVDYSILQKAVQNGINFEYDDEQGEQFQIDENGNQLPIKQKYKNPVQSRNDQFNPYQAPGQGGFQSQSYQNGQNQGMQQYGGQYNNGQQQPGQQYPPSYQQQQMSPQQQQMWQQQQQGGQSYQQQQYQQDSNGQLIPQQAYQQNPNGYPIPQQYGQMSPQQQQQFYQQGSQQGPSFQVPPGSTAQYDQNGQLIGYQTPQGFIQCNSGQQNYNSTDPLVPLPQLQKNGQSVYNNLSGQESNQYNGQFQQILNGPLYQQQGVMNQTNSSGLGMQGAYSNPSISPNGQPQGNIYIPPVYVSKNGQQVVYQDGPNGPGFYNEKGEFVSDGKDGQIAQVPSNSLHQAGFINGYPNQFNNNPQAQVEGAFNSNSTQDFVQMQGRFGNFAGTFSERQQLINQQGNVYNGGFNINLASASLGATQQHDPNDPRYMTSEQLKAERERQREIVLEKARRAKEAEMLEREMLSYKRVFADYNPSYLEKVEFEQPAEKDSNIQGLKVKGTSIFIKGIKLQTETNEEGEEKTNVILSDGQQVPLQNLYISIDKEYVIDAYGNKLLEDGQFRDKTNNIITDYKAHTLVHQKQFVRKLQESQAVKNVLKGHKLNAYIRKMYEIKQNQILEHQRQMENFKQNYGRVFLTPSPIHDFGGLYISHYGPNPNVHVYGDDDTTNTNIKVVDGRLVRSPDIAQRHIFQKLQRRLPAKKTLLQTSVEERIRQQWKVMKSQNELQGKKEKKTVLMNEQADFSASPRQFGSFTKLSPTKKSPKVGTQSPK